jgi:hypothetical protein
MRKYVLLIVMAVGLIAATYSQMNTKPDAVQTQQSAVVFDSKGRMKVPASMSYTVTYATTAIRVVRQEE